MKSKLPTSRLLRNAIVLDAVYHHYNDIVYLEVIVTVKDCRTYRFSCPSCDSNFRLLAEIVLSSDAIVNINHNFYKFNFYPKEKLTFNK